MVGIVDQHQANIGDLFVSRDAIICGNLVTGNLFGNLFGNLVGNVTGDVTGNLTGNVTGDICANLVQTDFLQPKNNEDIQLIDGNLIGNIIGNLVGDVTGDVTGNLVGDVTGDVTGNLVGDVTGDVTGNLVGDVTGDVTGNLVGDVTGDVTGNLVGDVTGDLTGDVTGNLVGDITGNLNAFKIDVDVTGGDPIAGTATLVGGTVTVLTTKVTASSIVLISRNTPGGGVGNLSVPVASIVASTSFVINSDSGTETSTINWFILN
jgi:uncharacterized protein YcfJ